MNKQLFTLLLMFLLAGGMLNAANRESIDLGIRHFKRGAYEKSLQIFREAYDSAAPENNVFSAISLFMIIRNEYEMGNYKAVFDESRKFEQLFPDSRYLPDVSFERAKALAKEGHFSSAMLSAVNILSMKTDEPLKNDVHRFCADLSRFYLSGEDFRQIEALVSAGDAMTSFSLFYAGQLLASGESQQAERLLLELDTKLVHERDLEFYRGIRKLLDENGKERAEEEEINIAVLLPLSGAYSNTGNDVLDGIKLAYELHRESAKRRYNMIIVDTESDVKKGLLNLKELLKIRKISAILGPLNSDMAVSMAPVSEYSGVPMITPTATADDLTAMGSSIFQLNPEQSRRAEILADYATDSLGYRRFAIVSPADNFGIEISSAFTRRVERNGGEIIRQLWYNGIPTDINDKLAALKKEAEFLPDYFSYLKGFYEARKAGFFEPEIETQPDSAYTTALDSIFSDSLQYAAEAMDSLYAIPEEETAEPADMVFLLESFWPDKQEIYELLISESGSDADSLSDSLLTVFNKHAKGWLSPEITIEEKYNTVISDSICILLDAVRRDSLPDWLPDMLAEYQSVPVDTSLPDDFYFAPLGENPPLNFPYIDLELVDSLKSELAVMDSVEALWLLAETDTVLFPYIFPFEKYGIDAVYMPVPQQHIQYIAPQWARHRFDAHLLGDGNWYNTVLLERYKSNIDSMIIASDYYWDSRDIRLRRFARDFIDKTGEQPNRIHIYGYESMDMLMNVIEKAGPAPGDIREALLNLPEPHGIIRRIEFRKDKPRSSGGVRLIRFYKGKISVIR